MQKKTDAPRKNISKKSDMNDKDFITDEEMSKSAFEQGINTAKKCNVKINLIFHSSWPPSRSFSEGWRRGCPSCAGFET